MKVGRGCVLLNSGKFENSMYLGTRYYQSADWLEIVFLEDRIKDDRGIETSYTRPYYNRLSANFINCYTFNISGGCIGSFRG